MALNETSSQRTFSESFTASLCELPDGERIKSCLQCGMCGGVCPFGYAMEYPPNKMIATLRAGVFDWVINSKSAWMCISCYACTQVCPSKIPLTATLMTRAKEELLLAGNVPSELQQALENSQRYGNVLGQSQRKRADWTRGLRTPVPLMGKDKKSTDVLWFVGDYGSYHPRSQLVSRAVAQILNALGVDFGILGPDEFSDGDSQRLAGERGLFETLAAKNGQSFRKYRFNQILVNDPHAYNAIKNQYPSLGISFPVQHLSQFLAERLDQLKPLMKTAASMRVAYHDACYLGRANGIYEEPRQVLQAIPGVELVEMTHHHSTSLCCGGGGGGMWMDGFQWEKAQARTTNWRIKEALVVKANTLAVACPYEPPRFEDAAKNTREATDLSIKDIAELVADALGD